MNQKNFTQKSQEAIQSAQTLSLEYGNPQIEQAHLLYTLLDQESGLIPQLVTSIGPDPASLKAAVKAEIQRLPKVSGSGRDPGKVYVSRDVDRTLTQADKVADQMKDEFLSVEHLFLALIDTADSTLPETVPDLRHHQGGRAGFPVPGPGQPASDLGQPGRNL